MAFRHVAQGRQIVESQKRLIEHLKAAGRPTGPAERLLDLYESSLRIFEDDLASAIAKEEAPQ
jgi:hypothetical protein